MKKRVKRGCGFLLGAVLLLFVAGACAILVNKPRWKNEYGQRFMNVIYGNREHNTYDLYLPANSALSDNPALILYVHGGSWTGGDKKMHERDCYTWLKRGYATATMNYSLLGEEGVSIPTMLDEIDACIQHIEGLAAHQGVRFRQMAIAGTSAGGHLAMMYAYGRSHRLPLRFAAIKVGPADMRILFPNSENANAEDAAKFAFSCTGEHWEASSLTAERLDSIKLQASPVAYINESTALPAIFAYGEKDGLVKPANYHALKTLYDKLLKPYDLIVYPNSNHFLMGDKDCSERYDSTMSAYCKKYFLN